MATEINSYEQSITVNELESISNSSLLSNNLRAIVAPTPIKKAISSVIDQTTNKLFHRISNKEILVQPRTNLIESFAEKIDHMLHKYDPNLSKIKGKEAKEFIEKIIIEKEIRKQHYRTLEQREADRIKKQNEIQIQLENIKIAENKLKKKEILKANFEKGRTLAEERRRSVQERILTKAINSHYLYKDWEKSFESQQKQLFERKLSQQKEISKETYKPLNRSEFDERAKRIEGIRQQQQLELYNKVKLKNEEFNQRRMILGKLHTKTTEKVIQQIEEEKTSVKKDIQEKIALNMKMKAYSHIIKETKTPTISPKKADERLQNIHRILISKRQPKVIKDLPDYLHLKCNVKASKSPSEREKSLDSEKSLPQIRNKLYPDYIKMQRDKREKEGKAIKKFDWEKDIKSNFQDKLQKFDNVITKAKAIEEEATKNEGLLKAKGGTIKDMQLGEHISDMLIDAIKAKLAVLDEL